MKAIILLDSFIDDYYTFESNNCYDQEILEWEQEIIAEYHQKFNLLDEECPNIQIKYFNNGYVIKQLDLNYGECI